MCGQVRQYHYLTWPSFPEHYLILMYNMKKFLWANCIKLYQGHANVKVCWLHKYSVFIWNSVILFQNPSTCYAEKEDLIPRCSKVYINRWRRSIVDVKCVVIATCNTNCVIIMPSCINRHSWLQFLASAAVNMWWFVRDLVKLAAICWIIGLQMRLF